MKNTQDASKTGHNYKNSIERNSLAFYISEKTAIYGENKPFVIYYDNPEHSLRLLKGDCIEVLNQARDNSVDMIFADPPYFLSNGGITCHAGKMVSVNKGKWDKSMGVEENHKFTLEWLLVLDPFCGSSPTGVSAVLLN